MVWSNHLDKYEEGINYKLIKDVLLRTEIIIKFLESGKNLKENNEILFFYVEHATRARA